MKKLILSIVFLSLTITAFCTIHTITNTGFAFTPATLTIQEGDTVVFDLSNEHNSAEVSQATWDANGNTPLAGGWVTPFGGGTVLPADLTVGTHWYVCQPHAGGGMKGMIIVEETTGTDEFQPRPSFALYPNPTTGNVQMTVSDFIPGKNYKVEVYDLHGAQVYTENFVELNGVNELTLSGIGKGIYFVRFYDDRGVRSRKLIIQ